MSIFTGLELYVRPEDILEKVTEEQLFKRYAKDFPNVTTSPFRSEKHESFSYFFSRNYSRWKWRDHGTGEFGNIFEYLLKDASRGFNSLQDVFQFIRQDMQLDIGTRIGPTHTNIASSITRLVQPVHQKVGTKLIQVVTRNWEIADELLWQRWLITRNMLEFYHVGVAQQIFVNKKLVWVHTKANPIYYYHFPVSRHVKAYRPLGMKGSKFIGNVNNLQDIYGYYQCDIKVRRPRLLILTKAGKECMFYRVWHLNAMAIQGEGQYFDTDFIRHLKKYCGRIISFYDNDKAGIHAAWDLRERYDIPAFFIPKQLGAKNITDLWEINKYQTYKIIEEITQWNTYRSFLNNYRGLLLNKLSKGKSLVPIHS